MSEMKRLKDFLELYAIGVFQTKGEVLEYFAEDNVGYLYEIILSNMGIDEWLIEMSHTVFEFDDLYYVLEERDLQSAINIEREDTKKN